ncbi:MULTISPECIES: hypothetical protein [Legionella]|uniref:hypothetical protein n=1 Tax=Legionella TaxID=445 RepID=UPI00095A6EDE|nr:MULTISPECIES: hypothetical protein [Legionella]MBN9226673.1 hypothetical protein [Legionella steelei]OJW12317.1 MAG: hypothetical protein BGO44_01700 [Legionella sp. 39-23]
MKGTTNGKKMKYITEKDFEIFDENRRLYDEHIRLEEEWLDQVKRHHNGEMSYEDTYPKFEESLNAYNKWKEFHDKNLDILLAKVRE